MAASLRSLAVVAAMLVSVVPCRASPVPDPTGPPSFSAQQQPVLEGIVLQGDSPLATGTVILHRVASDGSGEVDSSSLGPGGEFEFLLPAEPDGDFQGDIYFASVDHEGVVYFGSAITAPEQLDSLYVVRVYEAEEVPLRGVTLPVKVRTMFIEFDGEEWVATDLFALDNRGPRTLVAQQGGVVWSYPLPPGANRAELGEGDMPPDAVTFEGGRVIVRAPLPPGERVLMIRYRLQDLTSTIPAPESTEAFELLVKEPAPPLRVEGLEAVDVVALGPESTYRRFGGSSLVDVNLNIVQTDEANPPQLQWFAVLTGLALAALGLLAYLRPVGPLPAGGGLGREALILEVARVDDALADGVEADVRSELLERRAALLSVLRSRD